MFKQKVPFYYALPAILLATLAVVAVVSAVWTEPTQAPPAGNVAAPLNVSNIGQVKEGGLILNTGGAANGLIVDKGNVGIGTQSPSQKLEIKSGNVFISGNTWGDANGTSPYLYFGDTQHRIRAEMNSGMRFADVNGFWFNTPEGTPVLRIKNLGAGGNSNFALGVGTSDPLGNNFHNSIGQGQITISGVGDGNNTYSALYLDDNNFNPGASNTWVISHRKGEGVADQDNLVFSRYDFAGALTSKMVIMTNGNVGIGTVTPGAKLEVAGQIKITGGTPGVGKVLTSDASGLASWTTAGGGGLPSGTSGQTLRHDGTNWVANSNLFNNGTNVGIGTTSPTQKLEVEGGNISIDSWDSQYRGGYSAGGYSDRRMIGGAHGWVSNMLYINGWNDWSGGVSIGGPGGSSNLYVTGQVKITGGSPGAGKVLTSDASGLASWQAAGGLPAGISGQTLRYDGTWVANSNLFNNGTNVGIGTTSPADKLHVSGGNIRLDNGQEIFFSDNGQIRSLDNNHRILFRRSENKMELREYGDIIFSPGATSGNETAKMVIRSDGNVGIGTTNPQAKLDVAGFVRARTEYGDSIELGGDSSGNDTQINIYAPAGRNQVHLWNQSLATDAGLGAGNGYFSGNVGIGTNSPSTRLDVVGQMKITGGNPANYKVLTSDSSGVTSWCRVCIRAYDSDSNTWSSWACTKASNGESDSTGFSGSTSIEKVQVKMDCSAP